MPNPFTQAMKVVLKIVVDHQDYLQKNPLQLAKLMREYDDLHYASRFSPNKNYHDWDNLKYAIIDLEKTIDKKYANLVYDAWCATIRSEEERHTKTKLEKKKNKTMPEIVKMCLDPKYRYHSIYPTRERVLDQYLCTIGNGLDWNKEGFISKKAGPGGTDLRIFEGYELAKFPKDIKDKLTWLKTPAINQAKKKMAQDSNKENDIDKAIKAAEKFLKKFAKIRGEKYQEPKKIIPVTIYDIHPEYSLIATMPKNADPSFKEAAEEICHQVLKNKKSSAESKTAAKEILAKLKV